MTLPIKWFAARVKIGTAKGAKSTRPHLPQSQDQRKTASVLEPWAQLEFQWLTRRNLVEARLIAHAAESYWPVAQGRAAFRKNSRA